LRILPSTCVAALAVRERSLSADADAKAMAKQMGLITEVVDDEARMGAS
jgi:hypothetical protein